MANNKPIGVAYADPQLDSYQVGSSNDPISITSAGVLNGSYATTSATSGDTRLSYEKLTFTSTGSGETLRAFSVVTGTNAATAGTINGAHISCEINGNSASISGAANAIRATLGGNDATPGGTLAAIQLDSNFAAGVTLPGVTAFMRVTDSNTVKVGSLLNMPAPASNTIFRAKAAAAVTHVIKIVADNGTPYYIMVSDAV
jgi:hypothetical protein